jgi:hypothetical protein
MTALTVVAIIVCALIALVAVMSYVRWRREYDEQTLAGVKQKADVLLRRGYESGFMIVSDRQSNRFVQFRKYIHRKGEFGLELGFPRAPWSTKYYDRVRQLIEAEGLPLVVQPTNDSPVTEFLLADFGRDTDRLVSVIGRIFHEILAMPSQQTFRIRPKGIAAQDVLVDTPRRP